MYVDKPLLPDWNQSTSQYEQPPTPCLPQFSAGIIETNISPLPKSEKQMQNPRKPKRIYLHFVTIIHGITKLKVG